MDWTEFGCCKEKFVAACYLCQWASVLQACFTLSNSDPNCLFLFISLLIHSLFALDNFRFFFIFYFLRLLLFVSICWLFRCAPLSFKLSWDLLGPMFTFFPCCYCRSLFFSEVTLHFDLYQSLGLDLALKLKLDNDLIYACIFKKIIQFRQLVRNNL